MIEAKLVYKVYDDIENRHLFNIYQNIETEEYSIKIIENCKLPILLRKIYFDPYFRITDEIDDSITSENILNWLKDRILPENRDYLKTTLYLNSIPEYDWKVLIKYNKGRVTDDNYRVESV